MKLTDQQRETLKLIARSPKNTEGWAECADAIYEQLILPMPDELVEKNADKLKARLAPTALTLLEWL